MSERHHLLLDSCCLINLYASGCVAGILHNLPYPAGAVTEALAEADYILGNDEEGRTCQLPIDWEPSISTGAIRILKMSDIDLDMFVNLSVRLEEGEAATLAVGLTRGDAVATDDRPALGLLKEHFPHLEVWGTPSIMKHWSEKVSLASGDLAAALTNITRYASYVPSQRHALYGWWHHAIDPS